MNNFKKCLCGMVAVLAVGYGTAHASGPVVRLDDTVIARVFKSSFDPEMDAKGSSYNGNVSVDRRDASSMWVNIPLENSGAKFTMSAAVRITCPKDGELKFQVEEVSYESDNGVAWLANLFANIGTRIESGALKQLQSEIWSFNPGINWCPGIRVESDGALSLDYGSGDSCEFGETTKLACGPDMVGTGKVLICSNGRWRLKSTDCVPKGNQ